MGIIKPEDIGASRDVYTGPYVRGSGPINAKLLIVTDFPSAEDERRRDLFSGRAGQLLDEILKDGGLKHGIKQIYKTSLYKQRPAEGDIKLLALSEDEYRAKRDALLSEIADIKPNCVLSLATYTSKKTRTGSEKSTTSQIVFRLLKGDSKANVERWRGSILQSAAFTGFPQFKFIATYDPARTLLYKGGSLPYHYKAFISTDIHRAIEESAFPEIRLPSPKLEICKSAVQLRNFIIAYLNAGFDEVCVDIESSFGLPTCVALAFTSSHAMSVQILNAYNMAMMSQRDMIECVRILQELFSHTGEFAAYQPVYVIGQNFKYDQQKLENPWGFKGIRLRHDTMLLMHLVYPEFSKSLAFQASILTKHPYYKDDGKSFFGNDEKGSEKGDITKLFIYNARDTSVTLDCRNVLLQDAKELGYSESYIDFEMRKHQLYVDMEQFGVRCDVDVREELKKKYFAELKESDTELFDRAGFRFNYNHSESTKKALATLGVPKRDSSDEETLLALLGNTVKDPNLVAIIELILKNRKIRKTLSTYLLQPLDGDGRFRASYNLTGTISGRTSTSILEMPVRPFRCGIGFQNVTKHGETGADIRAMFIPDPGFVFLEADLSQAEARVVAQLAGDVETLQLFDTVDIHRLTAGWCFRMAPSEAQAMSKGDPRRFVGKTVRHAGNYGMKKRRLMVQVNTEARKAGIPITLSEKEAGEILDIFHKRTPKIQGVFHVEVFSALRTNRILCSPFGRIKQTFKRFDDDLLRESYSYLPQSTVKDQLTLGMLDFRAENPEIPFLMEAHDSCTMQVREDDVPKYGGRIKDLLERPIDFSKCTIKRGDLVIPAEVMIGKNGKDLEPV